MKRTTRRQMSAKDKAESWEKTAKMLEQYIDVPKEKLLTDIKRNREICNFLKPLTEVGKYFI